ncbi:sodium/potassium exporting P-type ATPase 2 [Trichomonascus vanleenenianus]|uniref:sodium/potassium exporting P-type ATPase 2 n=1 Tax=Trichomonascus vanleenenianus TaxID=2268995 RepID=UPI003ECAABC0
MRAPWTMSGRAVVDELSSDADNGLTHNECQERADNYGENALDEGKGVSMSAVFIRQVCNAMILVLLIAMAISFGIRDFIAGGVIAGVFVINVTVGFIQEFNAEKTMAALRNLASPTARVIRNGTDETIPSTKIVPGDIVVVTVGDTIPADFRIISAMNFETDEALLTGESLPVSKDSSVVLAANAPVGDRINMAFSSSVVSKGRAKGIVTATGMDTGIGLIAASLKGDNRKTRPVKRDEEGNARKRDYAAAFLGTIKDMIGAFLGTSTGTPLHQSLAKLSILLFGVAVVFAIVAMAAQKFHVNREVAVYAIAIALSMIPASLVVVLTITMAVGTQTMVSRNVIVRKLDSLEALGSVNDICSDKTGTLTQGKMIARKVWLPTVGTYEVVDASEPFNPTIGTVKFTESNPCDEEQKGSSAELPEHSHHFTQFLDIVSLANIAVVREGTDRETGKKGWKANGDPTEIAAQVFAHRMDWQRSRWTDGESPVYTHLAEFPFDSSIKRMSSVYQNNETKEVTVFTKGAAERIIGCCSMWMQDGKEVGFTSENHKYVQKNVDALTSFGLRVLAFARRPVDDPSTNWDNIERVDVEQNLVFTGLIGIYDPPRLESAGAVKKCHQAGINVHMLTGDHPGTAKAIAQEVGILPQNLHNYAPDVVKAMVMTATEFDAITDEEIDELPVLPLVIARCSPTTKVRMIEALHRRKAFSAMTGDGVNDSPSLKKADVGIAMGITGSDVAKDASDIVLSDDNFASILNAVEEGRRMTENIQKFVLHLLAGNISQALFLLIGLAFKDDNGYSVFPLSPVEVLWIIMVTSSFPAMGLGVERAEPDIMEKPPKDPKAAVFTWEVVTDMLVYGTWLAVICIVTFVGIVYGDGDGQLGLNCNREYSESCHFVYRARSTTFLQMTWCLLVLAWEVIDMRRSLFVMHPDTNTPYTQVFRDLWSNQFLFWSVVIGFFSTIPLIYIPVINTKVFNHGPISWEWAVGFAGLVLFVMGVELWKWIKRIYFRIRSSKARNPEDDLASRPFQRYRTISRSGTNECIV